MKRLLCGVLCAAAGVAFADVSSEVAVVEVRAINSGLTNTVVAIPGLDLADGGNLVVSNFVKTTNLLDGDMLYAFDGSKYEVWTLTGGKWIKPSTKFLISATSEGPDSSAATIDRLPVGSGIWLSRKASGTATPFYVYAAQPASTNSVIAAGAGPSLVGNPTATSKAPVSISGCANGDEVAIPSNNLLVRWQYNSTKSKWFNWVSGEQDNLPSIPAGTGFWYTPKNGQAVTINW